MQYKITRRLPMGFMGDWGRLYKKYEFKEEIKIDDSAIIIHGGKNYVDNGEEVQFKRSDDAKWEIRQEIKGAMGNDRFIIAKTTDAYWNAEAKEFECIVAPHDIVRVFGKEWLVKHIVTKVKYAPAPLKFFYLGLINLADLKNERTENE